MASCACVCGGWWGVRASKQAQWVYSSIVGCQRACRCRANVRTGSCSAFRETDEFFFIEDNETVGQWRIGENIVGVTSINFVI